MDLKKLANVQRELDDRIIKEKGLDWSPEDRLINTVVALDVELSEVANCAEWFKVWKIHKGKNDKGKTHRETLLEEIVDALHFYLSISNQLDDVSAEPFELETDISNKVDDVKSVSANDVYLAVKKTLLEVVDPRGSYKGFINLSFKYFLLLVTIKLDFTLEELENAYFEKNKINHERQDNNY